MGSMWKQLWKKWTLDKPAAFGDLLWDVLVVQFAAFLSRLTLRRVIAVIPLVILILAYAHSIPVPPELMLLGDLLAYIDIFTVIFLLGVLSRVATVLYLLKISLLNMPGQAHEWPVDKREAAGFPPSPRGWRQAVEGLGWRAEKQ